MRDAENGRDEPLSPSALPADHDLAVVLSGGAALGAYHMGACDVLLSAGREPSWMVGTSIGAITAAIVLGNPPDRRIQRLRDFWTALAQPGTSEVRAFPAALRARLGNEYGLAALLTGRPGALRPRLPGLLSLMPFMPPDLALHDHRPMGGMLRRLIDFDRLNGGAVRLSIPALDVETREEVWFDTQTTGIEVDHLLAATALVPLIAPIKLEGRVLCDAGLGNNLPLDRVLGADLARPTLCITCDLFTRRPVLPRSLDEAVTRVQDMAFSLQADRALSALLHQRDLRRQLDPDLPRVIVGQINYEAPDHERSLKALDFSTASIEDRTACGQRDMAALLDLLPKSVGGEGAATTVIRVATPRAGVLPDDARAADPEVHRV